MHGELCTKVAPEEIGLDNSKKFLHGKACEALAQTAKSSGVVSNPWKDLKAI